MGVADAVPVRAVIAGLIVMAAVPMGLRLFTDMGLLWRPDRGAVPAAVMSVALWIAVTLILWRRLRAVLACAVAVPVAAIIAIAVMLADIGATGQAAQMQMTVTGPAPSTRGCINPLRLRGLSAPLNAVCGLNLEERAAYPPGHTIRLHLRMGFFAMQITDVGP